VGRKARRCPRPGGGRAGDFSDNFSDGYIAPNVTTTQVGMRH